MIIINIYAFIYVFQYNNKVCQTLRIKVSSLGYRESVWGFCGCCFIPEFQTNGSAPFLLPLRHGLGNAPDDDAHALGLLLSASHCETWRGNLKETWRGQIKYRGQVKWAKAWWTWAGWHNILAMQRSNDVLKPRDSQLSSNNVNQCSETCTEKKHERTNICQHGPTFVPNAQKLYRSKSYSFFSSTRIRSTAAANFLLLPRQ